jgi:uncharacterized integral membrane protein
MKKFKIILALLIIALIAVFMFQNEAYFQSRHSLVLNLLVTDPLTSPELPNAVICLSCFFIGILLAYFSSLMERFKTKKIVKELNANIKSHQDTISDLRNKLGSPQSTTPEPPIDKPVITTQTAEASAEKV